jgi:S-DNA-T family DNA segregation ATPase FtsK/SpoIIIE
MAKKNNDSFWKKILTEDSAKQIFAWLSFILAGFFLISILSPQGILTSKVRNFLFYLFGWNNYLFIIFLIFIGYLLLLKPSWFKFLKVFLGSLIFFLIFDFYFHLIFREGGFFGFLIFSLNSYLGTYGLIFLSFIFLLFSLWLIFEERFFEYIKKIFEKTQEKIEELEKTPKVITVEEPIKQVRKEITPQNKIKEKIKIKTRTAFPKSIWKLPPLEILSQGKEEVLAPDIKTTSQIIEKTLENFGIKIEVVDVEVGPAITRFSIKPGEGVKLSKILSYQSDLALALGTPNLIIETPIPGKAVLGIQVPNKKSAIVRLGNLLREKEFLEGGLLCFPVGRKINGEVLFADLAKMPHLLIAGTTGSGKSIFIHNILISLLMKNTPETLNLILIDPKRVELINYSDLPHLIMDPVVETKKTLGVFNWLIEEMEERYKLLQETKSRDIDSYNQKQINKKEKIMPRIILTVDELADLMVTYGSSIETMIIRLTQMARATGIHLILATQRPSVDIVTGLIKANIPNRICFKVASYVDSRTVLDTGGAEKLIGSGDGLFISTTLHRPIRIKAPFLTESEIHKVIDFWKDQAEELPFERQTIPLEEIESKIITLDEEAEDEELFKSAVKIVLEAGKASTSLLQRRLKIGYARAARLLDLMEEKGIVGPQEGSKPRKVLISPEDLENINDFKSNL